MREFHVVLVLPLPGSANCDGHMTRKSHVYFLQSSFLTSGKLIQFSSLLY